jgi:ribose transport system substrate-binding protein
VGLKLSQGFGAKLRALALLVVVASAAACGSTSTGSGGSTAKKVIGIVEITPDPYTTITVDAIKAAAAAAGWDSLVVDTEGSVDQANSTMVTFAHRPVTAMVVTVYATTSLGEGIAAANAAHVPVISFSGGYIPTIAGAVDGNGGPEVVARMLQDIGQGGSVLEFTYHPGQPCLLREEAFNEATANDPTLNLTTHEVNINNSIADADTTAAAWVATHPKAPLAIFACYDDPAVGSIAALKAAGFQPGQVKIYGFNLSANAQPEIKDGWMEASMWFDVKGAGTLCFQLAQQAAAAGSSWKSKEVQIPNEIVDASNFAAWQAAHPNGN